MARTVQSDGQNSRRSRKLRSLDRNPPNLRSALDLMSCYPVMWEMEWNWLTGIEKYVGPHR
jgi:hypothetical protein